MKFLILTNHSYMLWQFRKELIEALLAHGEVVISTPFNGREEDFRALGCRMIETAVDRRGMNPMTDLKLCRTYFQMLKTEKPDMVITYSVKPNVYGGYACRKLGIPYCVNVQGLGTAFQKKPLSSVVTVLYRSALKKAKTVFFENAANREEFLRRKIVPTERTTLLPGAGINLQRFPLRPYPENEKLRFLFLGRLMKEKGVEELFFAVKTLHAEGVPFVLDLVGFFEEAYKAQTEELVREGIAVFHGFQEDPAPYYASSDCVVLPSYHEGMSNVLLEGAATGRPLITSDIPGCREAVLDGESGFLCSACNAGALTDAMRRFCSLSREKREAMGLTGRALMEERFEKSKVVESTLEAILKKA